MNKITKVGLVISLVGGVFLLGYCGIYTSFSFGFTIGISFIVLGGVGIIGVILAYYEINVGVKLYLFLGIYYGIMSIVIVFYIGFWVEFFVGCLLIFIGSMVAYTGWHKENFFFKLKLRSKKKEKKFMKKSHVFLIFLVIIISIELILVVLLFYFPEFNLIIYVLMVAIPIAIPGSMLIAYLLNEEPLFNIEQPSLTYKEFQLANPYFCERCSKYTNFMMQQCENCGAENSLRKTIKKDYNQYRLKHEN